VGAATGHQPTVEAGRGCRVRGLYDVAGAMQGVHRRVVRAQRLRVLRGVLVPHSSLERGPERERMGTGYRVGIRSLRRPVHRGVVVRKKYTE
jgi:hypothetical protein